MSQNDSMRVKLFLVMIFLRKLFRYLSWYDILFSYAWNCFMSIELLLENSSFYCLKYVLILRLTAFVLKCFNGAKDFIDLDKHMLSITLTWLLSKQNTDGSFREDGDIVHENMQVRFSFTMLRIMSYLQRMSRLVSHDITNWLLKKNKLRKTGLLFCLQYVDLSVNVFQTSKSIINSWFQQNLERKRSTSKEQY